MEIKDVLALINAGFSKDEIVAMFSGQAEPQAEQPPEPAAPADTDSTPINYDDSEVRAELAAVQRELAETKKMMQTMALLRDSAPAPITGADAGVDVLANIIKPSQPK